MAGRLQAAVMQHRAKTVGMGDVEFQGFDNTPQGIGISQGFGTEGLRGCSVVLVISRHGVIMSHIPPSDEIMDNPYGITYPPLAQIMANFTEIFHDGRATGCFSSASTTMIIIALSSHHGQPPQDAVEHRTADIKHRLRLMGLPNVEQATYVFRIPWGDWSPEFPGKGTVYVEKINQQLTIYVEDTPVKIINF